MSAPALRRALGKWDLTAIGVNQVIGAAIFLLPADVARLVGNWAPLMFLAVGIASLFVALCFAEVGSRFDSTGGPIGPARAAFGRFVGFEVGWMLWFSRVSSGASVINGLAVALGYYWPVVSTGTPRDARHSGRAGRAHVGEPARHQADLVARQLLHHRQATAARGVRRSSACSSPT